MILTSCGNGSGRSSKGRESLPHLIRLRNRPRLPNGLHAVAWRLSSGNVVVYASAEDDPRTRARAVREALRALRVPRYRAFPVALAALVPAREFLRKHGLSAAAATSTATLLAIVFALALAPAPRIVPPGSGQSVPIHTHRGRRPERPRRPPRAPSGRPSAQQPASGIAAIAPLPAVPHPAHTAKVPPPRRMPAPHPSPSPAGSGPPPGARPLCLHLVLPSVLNLRVCL